MIEKNLYEDTKQNIVNLVENTHDGLVLLQVLKTLELGNIDYRIQTAVRTNPTAHAFCKQISNIIISSDATVVEKDEFLNKFSTGILDVKKLIDGTPHLFGELVGPGFSTEVFAELSTTLVSQGVGPGEIALAVLSPHVQWCGRSAGSGDIIIDGKNIEVKTSVKSGGRWINARKAKMNLSAIKDAIERSTNLTVPARLGIPNWVNTFRPAIQTSELNNICSVIGRGLFSAVDTTAFERTLMIGTVDAIIDEMLRTGYENYKTLSGFDGMLMIDMKSQTAQYFSSYNEMRGNIKIDSAYLYGPESETMPKVSLKIKT